MSRLAIDFWFFFTLFGGLPLGLVLMALWGKKIFPRVLKPVNGQPSVSVSAIPMRVFVYMIPGFLVFLLCCVPVLYCGHLRKQREYCLQVVRMNKGITKDNDMLKERCGCFDLDELFAESAAAENR